MTNKTYSFLGLATKAGQLISGEDSCERAIRSGKAKLVIVAEDSSDNTKKKFENMCKYKKVDMVFFGEKNLLGKYIGKDVRSVLTITGDSFAAHLKKQFKNLIFENGGE